MKMDIGVVELCLTRFPQDVMVGSILKQNFRIVEKKRKRTGLLKNGFYLTKINLKNGKIKL